MRLRLKHKKTPYQQQVYRGKPIHQIQNPMVCGSYRSLERLAGLYIPTAAFTTLASSSRVRDCGGGGGAEICDDYAFIGEVVNGRTGAN